MTHGFWCPQPDGQAAIFPTVFWFFSLRQRLNSPSKKSR